MTEAEFRDAYQSHKNTLYRFARRMTGSAAAAEDIVQECFLLLLRNAAAYDERRGSLRAFLIGVARNLALKRLAKERAWDELEDEIAICGPIDAVHRERGEIVAQAVAALPPLQREAVILAEYEELSLEEITRVTGAELAAVKSRLHRARENLRRMLAGLLEKKGTANGTDG